MMRLIFVFAALAIGFLVLLYNHQNGKIFGLTNDEFGRLVMLGIVGAVIAAGVVRRDELGTKVRSFGLWVLIVLALMAAYIYRSDLENVSSRMIAGIIPGRATVFTDSEGIQEVVLHKLQNGHFETNVAINGRSVSMLVDTGASSIALSWEDAMKLGYSQSDLSFTQFVTTANGVALAAPVTLAEVSIGPIVRKDVKAMITQDGMLDQSLLGMSFLSTLDFLQMQTDELRLRD
ncbi:MAG TPA: TIGR02281 family clan AA aspartic protease [Pararhizobium sp.]|uniref:TIGR02281 family clan AA aspartic protease n=1 Tax=Pararhizobium sp. TaxID=1977563 RepID=UPI002BED95FC|nr:TIGR02281 family clan AA aspartic protease [Pararhizobium sp.]HTO32476.1 TIGR02281 family clan AA aspartic protease [Pararhizobium sp.]